MCSLILQVDSSFLKTIKDGSSKETPTLSTTVIAPSNNMIDTNTYSSTSNVVSSDDETVVSRVQSISVNRCNLNSMKTVDNRNASEQFSKMALAKLVIFFSNEFYVKVLLFSILNLKLFIIFITEIKTGIDEQCMPCSKLELIL